MKATSRNWGRLGRLAVGAALLLVAPSALNGCRFFNLGNPVLPQARLVGTPTPSMVNVIYTYKLNDGTTTIEAEEAEVQIRPYPNDASPGVFIHSYTAEYFDLANRPINTLELSRVSFGVAAYVPPAFGGAAGGATANGVTVQLPIYNQQVQNYGQAQVFSNAGGISLATNLIHTINCRINLIGEDDNYNQVEIPLNVPIRFSGNITQ